MLMMVDRNLHLHIIPPDHEPRTWDGIDFPRAGQPRQPWLDSGVKLDGEQLHGLVTKVARHFG